MPDYDKFQIRFPDGMRERLEDAARKNNRSLHQEIVERLLASFDQPQIEARLTALEQAVFKKGK